MSESYPEIEEQRQIEAIEEFLTSTRDEEATRKINEKCRIEGERRRIDEYNDLLDKMKMEYDDLIDELRKKIDEEGYTEDVIREWIREYFGEDFDPSEIISDIGTLKNEIVKSVKAHALMKIQASAANAGWDRLGLVLSDKVVQSTNRIGANYFRLNAVSRMARFRFGIEVNSGATIEPNEAFATIVNGVGAGVKFTCTNELTVLSPNANTGTYYVKPCSLSWDTDGKLSAGIQLKAGDQIKGCLYVNLQSYGGQTKYRLQPQSIVDRTVAIIKSWSNETYDETYGGGTDKDFSGHGWAYYSSTEGKRRSKITGTRKFDDDTGLENGKSAGLNLAINSENDRASNCGGVIRLAAIKAIGEYNDALPTTGTKIQGWVPQSATAWLAFGNAVQSCEPGSDIDWTNVKSGDIVVFQSVLTKTCVHVGIIVSKGSSSFTMYDLTSKLPTGVTSHNYLMDRCNGSLKDYYPGYRKIVLRWSADSTASLFSEEEYEIELETDNGD